MSNEVVYNPLIIGMRFAGHVCLRAGFTVEIGRSRVWYPRFGGYGRYRVQGAAAAGHVELPTNGTVRVQRFMPARLQLCDESNGDLFVVFGSECHPVGSKPGSTGRRRLRALVGEALR